MNDDRISRSHRAIDGALVISLCAFSIGAFTPLMYPLANLSRRLQLAYGAVFFLVPAIVGINTLIFVIVGKPLRYILAVLWTLLLLLAGIGVASTLA